MENAINVVVPVYNTADYLEEFFESVLRQTFKRFTLFVVNDASTDNSKEIILFYKEKLGERLLLIENERNLKLSGARNRGLDVAERYPADYISFLDPDDWIEDDFFENLYCMAEQHKADMVVCGIQRFEDETNKIICTEMVNLPDQLITDVGGYDGLAYINPSVCRLFRASAVRGKRFLPIRRSEDTCYFFEILPNIKSIKFTNRVEYHYRIRRTSLSGKISQEICDSMYDEFEKMLPLFETKEYLPFKELFESQIFIRSACGGVCRLSFANMKLAGKHVRFAYEYLNRVIPNWRKNQYLCFGKRRSRNVKQIMLKGCALLYKLHLYVIFVWAYFIVSQIFKKDIRM